MVDNRSAGFFGIGGSFNFKSGDISGTAAKLSDDKMGQGGEYFSQRGGEEEPPAPSSQCCTSCNFELSCDDECCKCPKCEKEKSRFR